MLTEPGRQMQRTWIYLVYENGRATAVQRITALEVAEAARAHIEDRCAALVADGWTRLDETPLVVADDVAAALAAIVELLDRHPEASGVAPDRLWRAFDRFRIELARAGLAPHGAAFERARRYRRLGELAEDRGDYDGAMACYRAALQSHHRGGVARRLAWFERLWR